MLKQIMNIFEENDFKKYNPVDGQNFPKQYTKLINHIRGYL